MNALITFVFVVFALLQFGLAYYLVAHRRTNFLSLTTVPAPVGHTLVAFACGFGASGCLSLVAAWINTTLWQVAALVVAAAVAGLLGLLIPKYVR